MKLKDFKFKLIEFAKTKIPIELQDYLRIPTTSASNFMSIETNSRENVRSIVNRLFNLKTTSVQISKNSEIEGMQMLESYLQPTTNNDKDISILFPGVSVEDLLNKEKNRVADNIFTALASDKTNLSVFLNEINFKKNQKTNLEGFMIKIRESLLNYFGEIKHPFFKHEWGPGLAENYLQISLFPNDNSQTNRVQNHYEIVFFIDKDSKKEFITFEIHAENNPENRKFMEPFFVKYDKEPLKREYWGLGLKELKGKDYNKLVQKDEKTIEVTSNFNLMIESLAKLMINTYNILNDPLINHFNNNVMSNQDELILKETIAILDYKKQIILQGPPGTGKTWYAKKIAKKIISNKFISSINHQEINGFVTVGLNIDTPTFYNTFQIIKNDGKSIKVKPKNAKNDYSVSYSDIEKCYLDKGYDKPVTENDKKGTGSYKVGITKYIHNKKIEKYFKLIQFHPAYNYEDFVRGISALPIANGVEYKVENRILAEFAKNASEDPFQNYVLIIDEINRANLPSVLGELIYALEYRDENVESMYGIGNDKNRTIIIPSNLYIIGTMNSADRSVGHIDYAIRRRFAFYEVLPSNLIINDVVKDENLKQKANNLYIEVSKLFYEGGNDAKNTTTVYLASDFKAKDVQIGHSYFIADTEVKLRLKLEYEIKPILMEYLKDGILLENAKGLIDQLYV